MKFIFPQNYKFNFKLFGLIDYQSAILDLVWGCLIFLIVNFIFINLKLKIFLFIVLVLPIFLFSILGINGENIINVITYIIKFLIKPKIFFYSK